MKWIEFSFNSYSFLNWWTWVRKKLVILVRLIHFSYTCWWLLNRLKFNGVSMLLAVVHNLVFYRLSLNIRHLDCLSNRTLNSIQNITRTVKILLRQGCWIDKTIFFTPRNFLWFLIVGWGWFHLINMVHDWKLLLYDTFWNRSLSSLQHIRWLVESVCLLILKPCLRRGLVYWNCVELFKTFAGYWAKIFVYLFFISLKWIYMFLT